MSGSGSRHGRELAKMVALTREGMRPAASGCRAASTTRQAATRRRPKSIAMAKATAPYGGVYSSHIRDEADYTIGVVAAVQEVIDIAEQGGVIGVVSHMKALGPGELGTVEDADRAHRGGPHARRPGVRRPVSLRSQRHGHRRRADAALGAGRRPRRDDEAHHRRAARRDPRRRCKTNIARRGGADTLMISRYAARPVARRASGSSDLAAKAGVTPEEYALKLLEKGDASLVSFNMSEADIELIMRQPWTMTCTDGDLVRDGRRRAASARLRRVRAQAEAICAGAEHHRHRDCDAIDDVTAGHACLA